MTGSQGPVDPFAPGSERRFGIGWSDQFVRLVVLVAAVVFVLWLARGIIGPFVVAAILAYAFSPVVSTIQRHTRLPRAAVIGLGYLLLVAALALIAFIAADRAGKEWSDLSSGGHDVISSAMHKLFGDNVVVAGNTLSVDDLARQIRGAFLGLISSPSDAVELAERAVDIGLQVVLCLIITFYFLLDGGRFGRFALRFLAREQQADALRLGHRIHVVLGRWLRGQLLLIALVAVVMYIILGPILHVPYALVLAILSGFLEIIPLVGPLIAAGLAGTVAFSAHGTDTTILVLVAYFVVRQIEDQIVMPVVIGRAVHLHPIITIFAVLVGLSAWGIIGGLLGVPVAAALNVILHELYPDETGGHPDDLETYGGGRRRMIRLPFLRREPGAGPMATAAARPLEPAQASAQPAQAPTESAPVAAKPAPAARKKPTPR
jgi:predicted PurR-regulated permease PerM